MQSIRRVLINHKLGVKKIGMIYELANLIEKLPEAKLWKNIGDDVWGNYYRNIHGIIEHTHYHLGQIVLIKKLLKTRNN